MNLLPVSHRQQIQQADCLAACAAMVLEYLQVPVEYKDLLRLLNVRAFGASLSNVMNLQTLGLFAAVREGHFSSLQFHLESGLPVVVAVSTGKLTYWNHEDCDHVVVVVGMDDEWIYAHDPAFPTAPSQIAHQEFESAWLEQDYRYAVIGLDEIQEQIDKP